MKTEKGRTTRQKDAQANRHITTGIHRQAQSCKQTKRDKDGHMYIQSYRQVYRQLDIASHANANADILDTHTDNHTNRHIHIDNHILKDRQTDR
jgi:hypothetical protein